MLAAQARRTADAGIWEFCTRWGVHTHSSLMCWAACDRLARIAACLSLEGRRDYWQRHAAHIGEAVLSRAWNEQLNSFAATLGGDDLDASLLLLPVFGLLPATDPRFLATVKAVEKRLRHGNYLFRYAAEDDFGKSTMAFTACTFWYIDALAATGRYDEARALFENLLARRSPLGLLCEDIDATTGELWGNFPQTYSMVGLINSAMRLSRPWEGAF